MSAWSMLPMLFFSKANSILSGDTFSPGARISNYALLVQVSQVAIVKQLFATDPEVFHTTVTTGIDELRYWIVNRLLSKTGEVEGG